LAVDDVSSAQAAAASRNCPIEPLSQPFAPAEYGNNGFTNLFLPLVTQIQRHQLQEPNECLLVSYFLGC